MRLSHVNSFLALDYKASFDYFDKDKTGVLSLENLMDGAQQLGMFLQCQLVRLFKIDCLFCAGTCIIYTPGLLATDIHIQILIILPMTISD